MPRTSDPEWDRRGEVAGLPIFWREAPGQSASREAAPASTLYLHGSPTSSDDFLPFLARTGGVAPDLPGFGRSAKPATFDYSIRGYARFVEEFLRAVAIERFSLVVHDWGAVGLALSGPVLARVERLVVINAVPFDGTYRWHRYARLWRTPVVGELTMGFTTKWALKRALRAALAKGGPAHDELVERVWEHFDHGTQRAILKLYRSAPSDELGRTGARLRELRAPALVLWGRRDPYIAESFAGGFARALAGPVRVEMLDGAGHWPWLDRPEAIETVARFLADEQPAPEPAH